MSSVKIMRMFLCFMIIGAVICGCQTGKTTDVGQTETTDVSQTTEADQAGTTEEDQARTTEADQAGTTEEDQAEGTEADQAGITDAAETETTDTVQTEVTDYSSEENWAYFGIGDDKDVDLFLVCPTVDMKDEYNMTIADEELKESFVGALNMERGIYEDNSRMYAPFYRQATFKVYELDKENWEPYMQTAYSDVSAAFSWYLEHENNGRPIIIAGFSQGADMCYRLLQEYFGEEDLYNQLVAVYAIGWPCTKELVDAYPQIKPAQSAEDIGVVISFDCESPAVEETFITPSGTSAYTINPLNWRTDGRKADKSENIGACFTDYSGKITKEAA